MTTIKIDEKTAKGKKLVEYLKTLDYVKFENEPNETTKKAMVEAKTGKVTRTKNIEDLMKKLES